MYTEAQLFSPDFASLEFWDKADALWQACQQLQLPIALYSLPGSTGVTLMIGLQGVQQTAVKIETLPTGFLCSPFANGNGEVSWFFEADLVLTSDSNSIWFAQQRAPEELKPLETAIASLRGSEPGKLIGTFNRSGNAVTQQKETYVALVNKALETIAEGGLHKVIASRTQEISFDEAPNVVALFVNINQAYPHAFISAVSLPNQAVWLGASPELLAHYHASGSFKTVALAGTQHILNNTDIFNAVWREKEQEEQAMVEAFIDQCFAEVGLEGVEKVGPRTVPAGNLMHLSTEFSVKAAPTSATDFASQLIKRLHPTSAICGMPRQAAFDFLHANEQYDREFYCGFLGPVNRNGDTDLYVNLRCMQLQGDKATLYAGAGITSESDPDQEWLETELKCQTLLNVLTKVGEASA